MQVSHSKMSHSGWLLAFPFLFVSFTVSIDETMANLQLGILLLSTLLFLFASWNKLVQPQRYTRVLLWLYLTPWLLCITIGYSNNFITGNPLSYLEIRPFGRLANILVLSLLLFLFGKQPLISQEATNKKIVRYYYYSLCILLLFAFWQIADFYFNFPIPFPFQTRSYMHSASDLDLSFSKRITSYTEEPSFLAPFVVEGIILSFVTISKSYARYAMATLFLIVCILTFSPSAYIALTSCILVIFVYRYRKWMLFILPLVLFLILSTFTIFQHLEAIQYFLTRIENYTSSSRYLSIILPIKYMFEEGNWITILFGYGTRSMGALYEAHHQNFPFGTSNTTFADILFECGSVGLLCYLGIYIILFKRAAKTLKASPIPLLLFVNFLISSLYRGDFSTTHFIANIILICIFSSETFLYTHHLQTHRSWSK